MDSLVFSFMLTSLAGLSTLIGFFLIYIKKINYNKIITSTLSFAAGVMICISVTDLIPESINLLRDNVSDKYIVILCILAVILGIIISMLIDYYLPENNFNIKDKNLYRVGFISMIAIILHNLPEGIATFMATTNDTKLGISLAVAIAMHNIPEGISIAVPIYYSTENKIKAFLYTLISAFSEPFGAIIAYLFLKDIMNDTILGLLFSLIAGIMLQISFCELIPSVKKYNNKKYGIIFFIIGIIFMLFKFII